jgi:hypothetical protein
MTLQFAFVDSADGGTLTIKELFKMAEQSKSIQRPHLIK